MEEATYEPPVDADGIPWTGCEGLFVDATDCVWSLEGLRLGQKGWECVACWRPVISFDASMARHVTEEEMEAACVLKTPLARSVYADFVRFMKEWEGDDGEEAGPDVQAGPRAQQRGREQV
jgi:hypothetical protein